MRSRHAVRTPLLATVAAWAGLLVFAPAAEAQPAVLTPAAINAVVEQYRTAAHVPGVAVTVTHQRSVIQARGYGRTADGARLTGRTVLAVASVSKSFTALSVLQLVERGLIDLDQPVRRYLPEFVTADPRGPAITVRQLLNQTSGLTDASVPQFSRSQPTTLRGSVADFRHARLASAPGTRWSYYNPNYQIAARLVEVVSGQPFDRYLAGHVFGPLGMTASRSGATAADLPPSAHGYLKLLGHPVPVPEPAAFGAGSGGVLSTAEDMGAWLIAQNGFSTGDPIISAASLAAMHRPSSRTSQEYGLGWYSGRTRSGAPQTYHSGELFTSTAYQALLPRSGYGIAVMANTGSAYADASKIGERLVALADGTTPGPVPDQSMVVDVVLLGLGVLTLAAGAVGAVRARRWAARHPRWRSYLLRVAPYLAPTLLLVFFPPIIGALYQGRDITGVQASYLFPSFLIFLVSLSTATIVVGATRLWQGVIRQRVQRGTD